MQVTWDEDDHICAGYMWWKHGDFGLKPEHPHCSNCSRVPSIAAGFALAGNIGPCCPNRLRHWPLSSGLIQKVP
jgi:hypothetical protein